MPPGLRSGFGRPTTFSYSPKEKAKETWLRQKAVEFRSQRLIDLESGIGVGKIYIPDGEYTVYVGNLRDAPKVRPASSLTLAKDHPDKTVLGYVWKLSDGNYVEAKEIIVTRTVIVQRVLSEIQTPGLSTRDQHQVKEPRR